MSKRAIVNVATGDFYCGNQQRLLDSFLKSIDNVTIFTQNDIPHWNTGNSYDIDLLIWRDCLPHGSKPHNESPYGFKVHAIRFAFDRGYESVLWVDSPAFSIQRNVSPIFEVIEKNGYYAMSHDDPLINWTSQRMLNEFDLKAEDIADKNLPSGSCYGFNKVFKDNLIFDVFEMSEKKGYFESHMIGEGKWHRHDETVLALILTKAKLPVLYFDPLFQSDKPECLIRSGAAWTDAKVYG
jgi:hypothetical protein